MVWNGVLLPCLNRNDNFIWVRHGSSTTFGTGLKFPISVTMGNDYMYLVFRQVSRLDPVNAPQDQLPCLLNSYPLINVLEQFVLFSSSQCVKLWPCRYQNFRLIRKGLQSYSTATSLCKMWNILTLTARIFKTKSEKPPVAPSRVRKWRIWTIIVLWLIYSGKAPSLRNSQ